MIIWWQKFFFQNKISFKIKDNKSYVYKKWRIDKMIKKKKIENWKLEKRKYKEKEKKRNTKKENCLVYFFKK